MNDRVETLLRGRRERLAGQLLRPLAPRAGNPSTEPLTEESRAHLVEYAQELYSNEMEWENITAEEETGPNPIPQLIFPGFLAFVRGLLLEEVMDDALAPAEPRPEIVEEVMRFLAGRAVTLDEELASAEEGRARLRTEAALVSELLDIVLYLYHGLSEAEVERLEELRSSAGESAETEAEERGG